MFGRVPPQACQNSKNTRGHALRTYRSGDIGPRTLPNTAVEMYTSIALPSRSAHERGSREREQPQYDAILRTGMPGMVHISTATS